MRQRNNARRGYSGTRLLLRRNYGWLVVESGAPMRPCAQAAEVGPVVLAYGRPKTAAQEVVPRQASHCCACGRLHFRLGASAICAAAIRLPIDDAASNVKAIFGSGATLRGRMRQWTFSREEHADPAWKTDHHEAVHEQGRRDHHLSVRPQRGSYYYAHPNTTRRLHDGQHVSQGRSSIRRRIRKCTRIHPIFIWCVRADAEPLVEGASHRSVFDIPAGSEGSS